MTHPSTILRRNDVIGLGGGGGYDPAAEPAEDYDLWLRMEAFRPGCVANTGEVCVRSCCCRCYHYFWLLRLLLLVVVVPLMLVVVAIVFDIGVVVGVAVRGVVAGNSFLVGIVSSTDDRYSYAHESF